MDSSACSVEGTTDELARPPSSGTHAVAEEAEPEEPLADPSDVETVEDQPDSNRGGAESPKPRVAPPPLPPAVETKATPRGKRRIPMTAWLFAALFLLNLCAIAGTLFVRREERRDVAPIASLSVGLGRVSAQEVDTRAELETAKATIVDHEKKIAAVARATDEQAARQRAADQEAHDREARAAREMAAIHGRVSTLERRARDGAVTLALAEALPVLDAVGGARSAPARASPSAATEPTGAHGPPLPPASGKPHGH